MTDQLSIICRIYQFTTHKELNFCMGYIGFNTIQNTSSYWTDCIICMRPYVQVINLSALVWKPNYKREMFPTKSSGRNKRENIITFSRLFNLLVKKIKLKLILNIFLLNERKLRILIFRILKIKTYCSFNYKYYKQSSKHNNHTPLLLLLYLWL